MSIRPNDAGLQSVYAFCCGACVRCLALSGGSQGGEFTSAFGRVAEMHGPAASVAFDANDPERKSAADWPKTAPRIQPASRSARVRRDRSVKHSQKMAPYQALLEPTAARIVGCRRG